MSLVVTVDDSEVRALFKRFPKIANSEINRGFNRTMVAFMREFTREKLRPGYFNPKRKVQMKRPPRGQPVIAQKARKAGFVARLHNVMGLPGKWITVYTGSPLLHIREYPRPIYPKKADGFMVIRGTEQQAFGRLSNKRTTSRRQKFYEYRGKLKKAWQRYQKPVLAKVRKIRPYPPLGFQSSWQRFQPKLYQRLDDMTRQIVRRAESKVSRELEREAA